MGHALHVLREATRDPALQVYAPCAQQGNTHPKAHWSAHSANRDFFPRPADVQSAQIIIPQSQAGRSNDIYVSIVGNSHQVTGKGKYAAIISTVVETDKPGDEVKFGVALLGELLTKFDNTTSTYEPVEDGSKSRVFITKSYDASSHFEAATEEVLQLYTRISGKVFDLSIKAEVEVSQ